MVALLLAADVGQLSHALHQLQGHSGLEVQKSFIQVPVGDRGHVRLKHLLGAWLNLGFSKDVLEDLGEVKRVRGGSC